MLRYRTSDGSEIDMKRFEEYADVSGQLPEHERTETVTELTRSLPAK